MNDVASARESGDARRHEAKEILAELATVRSAMVAGTPALNRLLSRVHPGYRESARNLLQYLALRRHDIRPLQIRLAALGLSSLGRAEPHVLATVETVIDVLRQLAGRRPARKRSAPKLDFAEGRKLLDENTTALLGDATPGRSVRIMVTLPSEAAHDYLLIHKLLENGMDCMRINCAHDDPETWSSMITHLRRAEETLGRKATVVMDLAGPKLRTGPVEPGAAVVKIRPARDAFGRVVAPARVWLTSDARPEASPSFADATVPVPAEWLAELRVGDRLVLTDVRGSKRSLKIADSCADGSWAEAIRTIYIAPGTVLKCRRLKKESDVDPAVEVGVFPPAEGSLTLHSGDELVVTRDLVPGRAASYDSAGRVLTPATIGCTIAEVFDDVRSGEPIWFDDGKIGGVVERIDDERVSVRITRARVNGEKLRGDKGINLPESRLKLSAMTPQDVRDLEFVAKHADVVELSFANSARDVALLQKHLKRLGQSDLKIVLKIETRRGFENLPEMLLTAMRSPCCGVMIARGDLAVECGFERLAEVQEEILWICEAAHVPVIWATQVLESLAKDGMPSRAEITDAAMGDRAECVMLNKGPHVVSAVRVLDQILRRMQAHQTKKRAMLRELRLAHVFSESEKSAARAASQGGS